VVQETTAEFRSQRRGDEFFPGTNVWLVGKPTALDEFEDGPGKASVAGVGRGSSRMGRPLDPPPCF